MRAEEQAAHDDEPPLALGEAPELAAGTKGDPDPGGTRAEEAAPEGDCERRSDGGSDERARSGHECDRDADPQDIDPGWAGKARARTPAEGRLILSRQRHIHMGDGSLRP